MNDLETREGERAGREDLISWNEAVSAFGTVQRRKRLRPQGARADGRSSSGGHRSEESAAQDSVVGSMHGG